MTERFTIQEPNGTIAGEARTMRAARDACRTLLAEGYARLYIFQRDQREERAELDSYGNAHFSGTQGRTYYNERTP